MVLVMTTAPMMLVDDAKDVRLALSPIRLQLLERLREPGSAASLAAALGLPRQKVGYHLRALEAAGLVTLHEERARRGFTERLFTASAEAFVIDPAILGPAAPHAVEAQDRHAAEHLVSTAVGMVRDVARMRAAAEAEGKRLLTFTVETEVGFARPADLERFTDRLAEAVADLVREFDAPDGGRRYRIVAGGHPSAHDQARKPIN
jgi:DNA-binding transcriptional ArsR family regulator